jgi:hypothetical protein
MELFWFKQKNKIIKIVWFKNDFSIIMLRITYLQIKLDYENLSFSYILFILLVLSSDDFFFMDNLLFLNTLLSGCDKNVKKENIK